MRVLWLSPVALPAVVDRIESATGPGLGWIDSLRGALRDQPDLELGIACISRVPFEPFVADGVTYLPIWSAANSTRLRRALLAASWGDRRIDYSASCRDAVATFGPDLIHVHGTETTLSTVIGQAEVPVVVSLQGIVSEVVRHYFDGVTRGELLRDIGHIYRTVRGHGLLPRYLALRRSRHAEEAALSRGHNFTGRTDFDREALRKLNPSAEYYHCDRVLRPEFYDHPSDTERERDVVYCAGGRAPFKGVEVAIAACAELIRGGRSGLRLRVGGPIIGTEMGEILLRRVRAAGIESHVEWLGRLDSLQIADELGSCSICIVPSHIDNSPNVLAEAMMLGAPCVASATGGIPSMVEDGKTGLLFAPGDSRAAARCLDSILGDMQLASSLSVQSAEVARVRHDPERIAAATMSMYSEMLSETREQLRPAKATHR